MTSLSHIQTLFSHHTTAWLLQFFPLQQPCGLFFIAQETSDTIALQRLFGAISYKNKNSCNLFEKGYEREVLTL